MEIYTGGLGNQLFQYCAYKNIAINNNAVLVIDPISGNLHLMRKPFAIKNKFRGISFFVKLLIFSVLKIYKKLFKKIFYYFFFLILLMSFLILKKFFIK